jgi:glycosyltransferase involved in cell wall biosynthesis
MKKICFVVSSPLTALAFLLPHLKTLSCNYEIYVVANTREVDLLQRNGVDITITYIPIHRCISVLADLYALFLLYFFYRRHRFDAVHSVTPKAGLLAMSAAWLARVPIRVHIFTGQVWATKTGYSRDWLKFCDKWVAYCSTNILIDSKSQREFLLSEGVVSLNKSIVLGDGSICGVDQNSFCPNLSARDSIRKQYSIPDAAMVLLFLGRMNYEKGILDLLKAFQILSPNMSNLWLLLVGPDEQNMKSAIESASKRCHGRIIEVGPTSKPEQFMAASDIFCMPSLREGFGSSVIEAAACGIPAVASRIYGLTDAVEEGVTGLLHAPGDAKDLAKCIKTLVLNDHLRHNMANACRNRCAKLFDQRVLTSAMFNFYQNILEKKVHEETV